jgi:hypothetical protein
MKNMYALCPPIVLSTNSDSLNDFVSLIFISTVYDSQTSLHTHLWLLQWFTHNCITYFMIVESWRLKSLQLRPFFAVHPSNRTERLCAFIPTIYLLTIRGRSSNRTGFPICLPF